MQVYDSLIEDTLNILNKTSIKELKVNSDVSWKLLKNNEFLLSKEVAFELGDRFKPSAVYGLPTSTNKLINCDKILLIGKDLNEIKENTNFSRITLFNRDDIKDPNKAYIQVKRLDYERYKMIPEGYMCLSSIFENKENIRVSKNAIKKGLNFEILGNLYINHYKKIPGVNNVQVIFIVGDFEKIDDLVKLSKKTNEVTNAFDHILKNAILDCDLCPLKKICEDVEELRKLHFEQVKKSS